METFDVIVLGAGSAGVSAALRASDQGAQVCIIEQEKIGGSCIDKGLYPLKFGLGLLRNNESNDPLLVTTKHCEFCNKTFTYNNYNKHIVKCNKRNRLKENKDL